MNFEDLLYNINRAHPSQYHGPLDHRNRVPLSSSPSSESETSSSSTNLRDVPRNIAPSTARSSSIISSPTHHSSTPHNRTRMVTTIEETPSPILPVPTPHHQRGRRNNVQIVYSRPLTHSGSLSSVRRQGSGDSPEDSIDIDLSAEQAFGLSAEQVIAATDQAERQAVIDNYPLFPEVQFLLLPMPPSQTYSYQL
ncbi:hypothetical protein PAXINDRAFT_16426 [Paxillus involutus ATCC 200175]|uniref:Uncharacterized protein n=1 Tax=Paxillus involutus ATCC 200175 TaxID=664439 RepID=A0A0C9TTR6_PAXIN|nr:hypothetical protein PAXINDRAFT_16426 [Paxillus involutus ATCC 200175]